MRITQRVASTKHTVPLELTVPVLGTSASLKNQRRGRKETRKLVLRRAQSLGRRPVAKVGHTDAKCTWFTCENGINQLTGVIGVTRGRVLSPRSRGNVLPRGRELEVKLRERGFSALTRGKEAQRGTADNDDDDEFLYESLRAKDESGAKTTGGGVDARSDDGARNSRAQRALCNDQTGMSRCSTPPGDAEILVNLPLAGRKSGSRRCFRATQRSALMLRAFTSSRSIKRNTERQIFQARTVKSRVVGR